MERNKALYEKFWKKAYPRIMPSGGFLYHGSIRVHHLKEYLDDKDVNEVRKTTGDTALLMAMKYAQNDEIVRYLLNRGADVNHANNKGVTPLRIACHFNKPNLTIVRMLLDAGADVNIGCDADAKSQRGEHILQFAEVFISPDPDLVLLLLEKGAKFSIKRHDKIKRIWKSHREKEGNWSLYDRINMPEMLEEQWQDMLQKQGV